MLKNKAFVGIGSEFHSKCESSFLCVVPSCVGPTHPFQGVLPTFEMDFEMLGKFGSPGFIMGFCTIVRKYLMNQCLLFHFQTRILLL